MDNNVIGLVGGGFKPPTLGHLNMVLKAINDNPNISEIIIFVGGKQRGTISQEDSINIWNIYKDLIPVKSQIISTVSPIKAIWDYVKENPTQNILFILGQRGQSDEDLKDAEKRTKGLKEKYPNVSVYISQTPDDSISGTKAREALEKSAEEFFKFLPQQLSLEKKQKIYNMLKPPKLNESNSQFGYRAERSGPQTPSERLKDKGIGLTNSKVGLLGSGYYFFGSLDKTQDLKSKLNYDNIVKIDLSQYNLYRPENPEDFYHNIKLVTYYINSLKPEEIQNPEVQEALDDAIDAFSEYFNIPLNKTQQIFNQYIDDILNKRDGDLLSNRLLYQYDGIDLTNTNLDDFSVGSVIFSGKLKPSSKTILNESKDFSIYENYYKNLTPSHLKVTKDGNKIIITSKAKTLQENQTYSEYINLQPYVDKFIQHFKTLYPQHTDIPNIVYKNGDSSNAMDFLGKTAYYDPNKKEIVLYTEGRHPKDIVRSLSHELIHFIQDIEGRIHNVNTTNTHEDDDLVNLEKEAYLKGNMNFRNWTDSLNENLAKNSNYLYHWTSYSSCMKIIESNELKSNKSNQFFEYDESRDLPDYKNVVFFTIENERFADEENSNQCILVVDKFKLFKDYKVISYGDPYEETVVYTNDSSIPILSYLKGVILMNTLQKSAVKKMVEFLKSKDIPYKINDKLEREVKVKKTKLPNLKKELISKLKLKYPNGFIGYLNNPLNPYQTPEYFKNNSTYSYPNITINKPGEYGKKNKFQVKFKIEPQNFEKYINWYMYSPDSIEDLIYIDNYEGEDLWLKGDIPIDPTTLQEAYLNNTITFRNWTDKISSLENIEEINTTKVKSSQNLEEILTEGRYDKLTSELSRLAFNIFKDGYNNNKKIVDNTFIVGPEDEDSNIISNEFEFDFEVRAEYTEDIYKVDGGANPGWDKKKNPIQPLLSIDFKIPKNPNWQKISFDIKDVIRHEIEHLTQDGENVKGGVISDDPKLARPSKQMADDKFLRDMIDADLLPKAEYFKLEKEVDAMLQGLYFKAKKSKTPFKKVINDYLDLVGLKPEEKEEIKTLWRNRRKVLSLPLFEESESIEEIGTGNVKPYGYSIKQPESVGYGHSRQTYTFKTESNLKYIVVFGIEYDVADVSFKTVGGSYDSITNKGELFTIMATVLDIIHDFLERNSDIRILSISPTKNHAKDKRRFQLYLNYIKQNLPNNWEYEIDGEMINLYKRIQENKKDIFGLTEHIIKLNEEQHQTDYQIYSDMDGVITDFDSKFKQISGGILPQDYEQKYGKDKFWEIITDKGVGFWVGMKWMSDGKQYWDYIKQFNPKLLSAPSRHKSSRLGKRLWVKNNIPGVELILRTANQKREFASPNSILIDDRPQNIEQWVESGGIGILHTSASSTIEQLKKLGL